MSRAWYSNSHAPFLILFALRLLSPSFYHVYKLCKTVALHWQKPVQKQQQMAGRAHIGIGWPVALFFSYKANVTESNET